MRIEYQGHVEANPSYSHVGYLSAAQVPSVFKADQSGAWVFLGLALLCAVSARRLAARGRGALLGLGVVACLVAAGAAAVAFASSLRHYELTPAFTLTVQRLERLSEATDNFERQHKRLPTQQEWSRLGTPEDHEDAWGNAFVYTLENRFADRDGRPYGIMVAEASHSMPGRLSSAAFGRDGLIGTEDDCQAAGSILGNLKHHGIDLTTFPHGRTPRPPSPTANPTPPSHTSRHTP